MFKDGYLVNDFLNKDYRSLVGWKCAWWANRSIVNPKWEFLYTDNLMSISKNSGCCFGTDFVEPFELQKIRIDEFTIHDIPQGELCWFSDNGKTWYLSQFDRIYKESKNVNQFGASTTRAGKCGYDFKFCVPFLIAETEVEATQLKDWYL